MIRVIGTNLLWSYSKLCRSALWDCLRLLLLAITRLRRKVGLGRFSFSPKLRKFRFGIFGTNFEDGQFWPVRSFRSVITNCPFPIWKNCCPQSPCSTALLHPAYKNSNQTRSGLGRGVFAKKIEPFHWHVEFPKFKSGIFVEWRSALNFSPKWSQVKFDTKPTRSPSNFTKVKTVSIEVYYVYSWPSPFLSSPPFARVRYRDIVSG